MDDFMKTAAGINHLISQEQRALALHDRGVELYCINRLSDSVVFFNAALALHEDPEIYVSRATTYSDMLDFHAATKDCERALSLGLHSQAAYAVLGVAKAQTKDYSQAATALVRAIEINCTSELAESCNYWLQAINEKKLSHESAPVQRTSGGRKSPRSDLATEGELQARKRKISSPFPVEALPLVNEEEGQTVAQRVAMKRQMGQARAAAPSPSAPHLSRQKRRY